MNPPDLTGIILADLLYQEYQALTAGSLPYRFGSPLGPFDDDDYVPLIEQRLVMRSVIDLNEQDKHPAIRYFQKIYGRSELYLYRLAPQGRQYLRALGAST